MGPYNFETCELTITDDEFRQIRILGKDRPFKLLGYTQIVREIFDIPSYKEIRLKVENGSVL